MPVLEKGQTILGKYTIESAMDVDAGMSVMFKAVNNVLGYPVAVKQLKPELWSNREVLRRFKIEAVAQSNIEHPAVVRVIDYDVDNLAIVMEFVSGRELGQVLSAPLATKIDYFLQALDGLAAAHQMGVVHRDLKPSNIFVTNDGHVKIGDFGIAKILGEESSQATMLGLGTPYYMSPEQIQGDAVTERSDIYSLGVVMYFIVSGRLPFKERTMQMTALSHLKNRAPAFKEMGLEDVPEKLEKIIFRCLEKNPARRYGTALELKRELAALAKPKPEDKPGAGTRLKWAMLAVLAVVLLGYGLYWFNTRDLVPVGLDLSRKAYVNVDGRDMGAMGPGAAYLKLGPGNHDLVFSVPGFMSQKRNLLADPRKEYRLAVKFPDSGVLSIMAAPGSDILLNGELNGTAPLTQELKTGRYVIEVGGRKKQALVLKGKETTVPF